VNTFLLQPLHCCPLSSVCSSSCPCWRRQSMDCCHCTLLATVIKAGICSGRSQPPLTYRSMLMITRMSTRFSDCCFQSAEAKLYGTLHSGCCTSPKTRVFVLSCSENTMILCLAVSTQYKRDTQRDRQRDRMPIPSTCFSCWLVHIKHMLVTVLGIVPMK